MHLGFALLTMFPGRVGGSETYVRGLLGEYGAGHGPESVTVLANRHVIDAYGSETRGPVATRHVRSYWPGDSNATRYLALQVARVAPWLVARDAPRDLDLIHYPVSIPIPRVAGIPRVVTLLDVQHHELPDMFSAADRRLRSWAYADAARGADLVITISEHSRQTIAERLGIDPARIVAIPLGVDHDRFRPDGPRDPAAPERYVFYPANMWPHKNHARLLEAFEQVGDPELHLVLTGQAYGNEQLLHGRERVTHLGHVAAERLPGLYRGAIATVIPSLFEGFGLPALEAMASGCPVAVSSRGSLGEVAGDAALTFDPDDAGGIAAAIRELATSEELRDRLRERGLGRAAEFTWAATAQRHLSAYRQALRGGA